MGPKKALTTEEGDDIRRLLVLMIEEISAVKTQKKGILNMKEIKALPI